MTVFQPCLVAQSDRSKLSHGVACHMTDLWVQARRLIPVCVCAQDSDELEGQGKEIVVSEDPVKGASPLSLCALYMLSIRSEIDKT